MPGEKDGFFGGRRQPPGEASNPFHGIIRFDGPKEMNWASLGSKMRPGDTQPSDTTKGTTFLEIKWDQFIDEITDNGKAPEKGKD